MWIVQFNSLLAHLTLKLCNTTLPYNIYMQAHTEEHLEAYRAQRTAKHLARKCRSGFISDIENDTHGRQTMEYKFKRHRNGESEEGRGIGSEKDTADIDIIRED